MTIQQNIALQKGDERIRRRGRLRELLIRPELGSVCALIGVLVLFGIAARGTGMFAADGVLNWTQVSSQFAILAVGSSLLMIAGEFDLSVGSLIGFSGMLIALTAVHLGWPMGLSVLASFVVSLLIGFLNGYIVVRTRLPSFIVTLASLFILRGLTIWASMSFTRQTIVNGLRPLAENDPLSPLFSGKVLQGMFRWLAGAGIIGQFPDGTPVVEGIPALVVWAVVLVAIGQYVLMRTQWGNWIFAAGGDARAALYVGVPVARVKIALFMCNAFCATVFAACQVLEFGSAAADRGLQKEFEAIIAAVIGGVLLTGGYGTVVGAAIGAFIFGIVQQGLFFVGIESSLFRVFLGVILLVAVIFNTYVRRLITGERA